MENISLWVPAAPFRAHVNHVMAATGLPHDVIAAATGVPAGVVRTLVRGRDGKARPHLRRRDASRLLRLTAEEADRASRRLVNPHEAAVLLRLLVADGMDADEAGATCLLSLGQVDLLLTGRAFGVVETSLWRLRALAVGRGIELEDIRIAA